MGSSSCFGRIKAVEQLCVAESLRNVKFHTLDVRNFPLFYTSNPGQKSVRKVSVKNLLNKITLRYRLDGIDKP